jgi:hypothetical protein
MSILVYLISTNKKCFPNQKDTGNTYKFKFTSVFE